MSYSHEKITALCINLFIHLITVQHNPVNLIIKLSHTTFSFIVRINLKNVLGYIRVIYLASINFKPCI